MIISPMLNQALDHQKILQKEKIMIIPEVQAIITSLALVELELLPLEFQELISK
jgi:hypothetical protein